jgi:translation initiation factor IF-2
VREVGEGFECGMSLAGYDQMLEGDVIEGYEIEKIARKL